VLRLHADLARLRKDFDDACAELSALGTACDELRLQLEHLRLPRFPAHLRPDKDGIWIGLRNAEERAAVMRLFQIDPSYSSASRHQEVAEDKPRIARHGPASMKVSGTRATMHPAQQRTVAS
jgi:hypothetical protein